MAGIDSKFIFFQILCLKDYKKKNNVHNLTKRMPRKLIMISSCSNFRNMWLSITEFPMHKMIFPVKYIFVPEHFGTQPRHNGDKSVYYYTLTPSATSKGVDVNPANGINSAQTAFDRKTNHQGFEEYVET